MNISDFTSLLLQKCSELSAPSAKSYTEAFAFYGLICPKEIVEIEAQFKGGFIEKSEGESWHFYSPDDLAKAELHVPIDIRNTGLVPLIDCKENLFICAAPSRSCFVLFDPFEGGEMLSSESLIPIFEKLQFFISN